MYDTNSGITSNSTYLEPPDELVGRRLGLVERLQELRARGDDGREHPQGGAAHL